MNYREQALGRNVKFLLPSLKLKEPCPSGETVEQSVHAYLMEHFGGYTATSANLFGYWREENGKFTYGEHREFTVALRNDEGLPELKDFLGRTANTLGESLGVFFSRSGLVWLLRLGGLVGLAPGVLGVGWKVRHGGLGETRCGSDGGTRR